MADHPVVELRSPRLMVRVDPRGAQPRSVRTAGEQELLWQGDPASWPDQALILFPVVGPLVGDVFRYGDKEYPMPPHGFARFQTFDVAERSESRCVLELVDSAETRLHYPFAFRFTAEFEIDGAALVNTLSVENRDSQPMPADVGFHPGFKWPLEDGPTKDDYRIEFEREEPAPIRRGVDDPIKLTPESFSTPVQGRILQLQDALFQEGPVVFDRLNSRSLLFRASNGLGLRIQFPDCPYLALWMIPGAKFLAIEPWQGLPTAVGYTGPFSSKPGTAHIAPGERRQWRLVIEPTNSP